MKKYIAVAGNIGVGKSTLTALLADRLGWEAFYESVDENPYLADFYREMTRWSFHSQVFFLSRRLRHHRQLLDRPGTVVEDRTIFEDAEIFAENLYRQGHMEERDYQTYRGLYEAMTLYLPAPNLVVYLRASVTTLQRRIRSRGRDYEQEVPQAYLEQLNTLYEEWLDNFSLCPVLTVPADNLDFVKYNAHMELITRKILEKLAGKEVVVFD
jgi:deoxyadenosine/deoxycytidine kinase